MNRPLLALGSLLALAACSARDTSAEGAARDAVVIPNLTETFVSVKARFLPNGFIRHQNGIGRVDDVFATSSDGDKADATWALVPGLAGSCSSFESRNYRGFYLRHQNGDVYLQPFQDSTQFRQDATFCQVPGLADPAAISFRAFQSPQAYLRHASGVLHLADDDGSAPFHQDATFTTAAPWLVGKFFNPILGTGSDPSMAYANGTFYLAGADSPNGNDVVVRASPSVEHLEDVAPVVAFHHPACPAPACNAVWAPELQFIGGRWWIYFAGEDGGGNASHRMYVLRGSTNDPTGPYTFRGQLPLPDSEWAIDGTYFEYAGKGYFMWSGWLNGNPNVQHLFIVRMKDPMTPMGPRVRIASPAAPWETVPNDPGVTVNEGPEAIVGPSGKLFVTFSANGSWTDDYCLGQLSLHGDPMDPAAWTKSDGCVFSSQPTATAPGHNGFLSVNGRPWLAYHALITAGTGWGGRSIRLQPMSFGADGAPALGVPTNIHVPISLP